MKKRQKIAVARDGPYLVSGGLPLGKEVAKVGKEGEPEQWVKGKEYPVREDYWLCRCGKSKDKPFCDGKHADSGFDGAETASRKPYSEQARRIEGPELVLGDAESLCASARFCLPKGGTWRLTLRSRDPEKRKTAVQQACDCPSGRLVAYDRKTGKPVEPEFPPSLSLIEDPQAKSSGPIWVKGRVAIVSADGEVYEKRNRVTLCRCGGSENKPFCDGTHVDIGFNDGDPSLRKRSRTRKTTNGARQ
ncbi:MAG TPA: CDGSH iron-sulfur domain-containing protein [bacterium]|nr:CDGSH iron-sulfur domain-containing protein [bacterium]